MIILLEGYLCIINVLAFALYGIDKRRARTHHWRIPERRLLSIAWLGGALGALLGMGIFHHKTKHMVFRICIPLALVCWILGMSVLLPLL